MRTQSGCPRGDNRGDCSGGFALANVQNSGVVRVREEHRDVVLICLLRLSRCLSGWSTVGEPSRGISQHA